MPPNSNTLVGELQYFFGNFLKRTALNKSGVPYPVSLSDSLFSENRSFIRLLFDDTWPRIYTSYRYLYREDTTRTWPSAIKTRLLLYPVTGRYFIADDDPPVCNTNIFSLTTDATNINDLQILDKLLEYRTADSTASIILDIDYNSLSTQLSRMVYLYLDLKLNNSVLNYDNETLLSIPSSVLECCYEVYLVENMFNYTAMNSVQILSYRGEG